ncbi:MAG: LysR family transcriptional regulator [Bdellovibrionota bacterium]
MEINIENLKVLIALEQEGSFRNAAQAMGMSQASVTNRLAILESHYKTPLLVLEGKKKVFTPFGRALTEIARTRLSELEISLKDIERLYSQNEAIPLRIGCRPEVFSFVASSLPSTSRYRFIPLTGPEVAPSVLSGIIDIGFSAIIPNSLQLLSKKAFKSNVRLVVHKKLLPKLRKGSLLENRDFLAKTPALSYGDDGHLLVDLCKAKALDLSEINIRFTADSWTILRKLVESEKGYAILPNYVDTNDEVVSEEIPNSICKNIDFHILLRTAFKDVPMFKEILKVKWV